MDYVIVALFQLAFSILKVFDVKWSYDNDITKLVLGNFALSALWLASTAIGIVCIFWRNREGNCYNLLRS